ncbi:MAG: methionyl-tRNA formyltransferase [Clostridia bacterium]|nr:methionyl-tRNA formyltransferase [Clostridia bacterium]
MKIVWVGFHEEGIEAFRQVLSSGKHVDAFITLDDEAFEKRSAGTRGYRMYCEQYGVDYLPVHTIKGDEAYEILMRYQPDLLIVLGWSEILPERLLDIPKIGTVGTHAALLPHNRGSAPVNWAIIRGETETGNTLMWLSKEVDAGDIISQRAFPITPYDSCKTIYDLVAVSDADMTLELIEALEAGKMPPKPETKAAEDEPILPRRRPKDGIMNWQLGGEEIYNFIRALTDPYSGAFTYLNGRKWLIWRATCLPVQSSLLGLAPGEIGENCTSFHPEGCGILVGTGSNVLMISEMEDDQGQRYMGKALHDLQLRGVFADE